MEIWKPASECFCKSSESEVSFWKPSEEAEGSIWIPSSESEGSFWKPSSEFSTCKSESEGSFCKWKPSSESEGIIWKSSSQTEGSFWKPWKQSSEGSISNPSSESEEPNPSLKYNVTKTWCNWYCDEPIENVQRRFRLDVAEQFRKEYKFEDGEKTCISSNGIDSWPDKCYDSLWVAVHGVDSICMVTRSKDVDMTRVGCYYQRYYTNERTLLALTEAVISEIECLPYDDEEFRGKGIEKPFSIVSVPGTKKVNAEPGHEDSSAEYDEEKAIKYLKKKMKTDSELTFDKTIKTAISAFQRLCCQEFKAEDIWVTVWNNGECSAQQLRLEQKMWHLSVIGRCSFASRSDVFFSPPPVSSLVGIFKSQYLDSLKRKRKTEE